MSDLSDYLLQGLAYISAFLAILALYSLGQAPWGSLSANESAEMNERFKLVIRISFLISGLLFLAGIIALAVYGMMGFFIVFGLCMLFTSWAFLAIISLIEVEFGRFNFHLRVNRVWNFGVALGLFAFMLTLTKMKAVFLG
ncbi:MAG: hypothetical protein ACI82I_003501 [Gammaproteobacteria bacterium]|jgi:hypothetical protein